MPDQPPDLPPPNHRVFVDFENVHQIDLSVIGAKSVYYTLLLGARQTRLDVALVEMLMGHASAVQIIRLNSSGKNALDFALAYYVGRAVTADPSAYFHIISKDKGFDPLVEHLRSRHVNVARHDNFSTLTFTKPQKKEPSSLGNEGDLLIRVLDHLRKNTKNRPKGLKTLESHLKAFLGKQATPDCIPRLIEGLQAGGHISIDGKGRVTYSL